MTQKQRSLRIEPDPHGIGRYGRKAAEMDEHPEAQIHKLLL